MRRFLTIVFASLAIALIVSEIYSSQISQLVDIEVSEIPMSEDAENKDGSEEETEMDEEFLLLSELSKVAAGHYLYMPSSVYRNPSWDQVHISLPKPPPDAV